MSDSILTKMERAAFARFADVLIPSAEGRQSASQAGVATNLLDLAGQHVPERLIFIKSVLEKLSGADEAAALETLKTQSPADFDMFCETVGALYFMSSEVRARVGFPGRLPVLARTDTADFEELLAPVLESGFTPREV